jgi:hypothetical protein
MNVAAASGILQTAARPRMGRPPALSDADRAEFLRRLKAGEKVGDLSREYSIALTTGYRIVAVGEVDDAGPVDVKVTT